MSERPMRVALAHWSCRRVGGAERYLGTVMDELVRQGCEVCLVHEMDEPGDRQALELPAGAPSWSMQRMGRASALDALREWRPDVVFSHILLDPAVEAELQQVAPAVFFAHAYYGTCISGLKTWQWPEARPCGKPFGPACLLHYYPHRCGGLNPLTMLRDYRVQRRRNELLDGYAAVVTNSRHMRAEYVRNGVAPDRAFAPTMPLEPRLLPDEGQPGAPERARPAGAAVRLLFLGRIDRLKGGMILLEALPEVARALGRPVRLRFAGSGPDVGPLEAAARVLSARHPGVSLEFAGWVAPDAVGALWAETDLLVVPSVWPEPFGLIGVEGGAHGVPAAAFTVGGIPDWLSDGLNGHLAPADPPTSAGLAEAIVRCLEDPEHYRALRRGALEVARRHRVAAHVGELLEIFRGVVAKASPSPGAETAETAQTASN